MFLIQEVLFIANVKTRAVRYGQKIYITIFLFIFSISILITILTQTDMLYSYKCILCEFETYFQRKLIRPFPKSCNMSLEQTYGKIHIYIYILYVYVSNQIQQNNMQPEHVSEVEQVQYSALCVCAPLSRSRPKQTLR